jgi:hypothetical protein
MTPEEWKALVGKLVRVMYRDRQEAVGIVTAVEDDEYDEGFERDIVVSLTGRGGRLRSEGEMAFWFNIDNPIHDWHVEVWTG